MSELDFVLADVAKNQHCIVTLADVRDAGGKRRHADARVGSGRWEEPYDGVYRIAGIPWTWEAKVFAATCAAGPGAAASHLCAARLHGLGFPTAGVEISVPRKRKFRNKSITVHTSTDLDRCQLVLRDGIAITDPARTVLDLARYLKPTTLRRTIERGRRLEVLDWHALVATLAAHARQGRHGIVRLRDAIETGMTKQEATDTDSELMAFSLLVEHNFGEPVVHHRIHEPDGRITAEIDLAYPDRRKGFEIDGDVHLRPEVKVKDEARDHDLRTRLGWTIRRIWWEIPMYDHREFLRIVRETLA